MKLIMTTILLIIITVILSCRGERWDDKLTLPKQDYNGSELRVDGYYYHESDDAYEVFFFYRNGTTLYGGFPLMSEIANKETTYLNGSYYNFIKNDKTSWGRFIIEGNVISREFWRPSSGGPSEVYTHSGVILNDTTFQITKAWRSCKPKKKNDLDRVYHFKQFLPKPDSTNAYTN